MKSVLQGGILSGELFDRISILYASPELRKEFGENAHNNIALKFSHNSIVGKIDRVYQSILHLE